MRLFEYEAKTLGGDPIIGSNFIDLVPLFEKDTQLRE